MWLRVLTGEGKRLGRSEQGKVSTGNLQSKLIGTGQERMGRKHCLEPLGFSWQQRRLCNLELGGPGLGSQTCPFRSSLCALQPTAWVGAAQGCRPWLTCFPRWHWVEVLCWFCYLENTLNSLKFKTKIIVTKPYVILILWRIKNTFIDIGGVD